MTVSKLKFELVLPCYNEAKSLERIVDRTIEAGRSLAISNDEMKLILVENGSSDSSREVLSQLQKDAAKSSWFRVISIDKNDGYGAGLWAGLSATTSPFVGWSHADQQCDPKEALKAYLSLSQLGSERAQKTLFKGVRIGRSKKDIFVSRTFAFFAWIFLGFHFYEINAQPKVFARDLLGHCPAPPKDFAFDLYVLFRAKKMGYQFETIEVEFPPRLHGLSNWAANVFSRYKTILKMINYMRLLAQREGRIP